MEETQLPWPRRPRAKVKHVLFWVLAVFWTGVAFLVGLGVIVDENRWWAQALGGLVSAASVAVAVLMAIHLKRPVRTHDDIAPTDGDAISEWTASLEKSGHVGVVLSPFKVATTFAVIVAIVLLCALMLTGVMGVVAIVLGLLVLLMIISLALIPHLQFATGGKPVVLVDSAGIHIARWGRLTIPWSAVEAVVVLQSTSKQANVVVRVTSTFFEQDLANRPSFLRLVEAPFRSFTSYGYSIPSTTAANPRTLAAWLSAEALRRSRVI